MMDAAEALALLRPRLAYDPLTGIFTWKSGLAKGRQITKSPSERYCRISVEGGRFLLHRVAWLFTYGQWPSKQIDHINRDGSDNRITNLRDVSSRENAHNRRSFGRAALRGVTWYATNKKWAAQIWARGASIFLGYYDDPADAAAHYKWACISYDREFF